MSVLRVGTLKRKLGSSEVRLASVLWVVIFGLAFGIIAAQLWGAVGIAGQSWRFLQAIPRMDPLGADYWYGSYLPARELLQSGNPYALKEGFIYPPLVALLGVPLSFLPYGLAYRMQLLGLLAANAFAIVLISSSATKAIESTHTKISGMHRLWISAIAGLILLWDFTSYGLLFSLERGNYDAYALVAMAAALWFLVAEDSSSPWWPALLVGLAANLKVYPLILLVLVVWRYRWRSALPIVVGIVGPLAILGPLNMFRGIQALTDFAEKPYYWAGNHSAFAFGALSAAKLHLAQDVAGYVFLFPVLLVWLGSTAMLLLRGWSAKGALLQFAVSIPAMCLVPSVSHDYKLVLVAPMVLILLLGFGGQYAQFGKHADILAVVLVLIATAVVAVSFAWVPSEVFGWPGQAVANKYPVLLAMQLLAFLLVLRSKREPLDEQ